MRSQPVSFLKVLIFVFLLGGLAVAINRPLKNAACLFQNLRDGQTTCLVTPPPFYGYMQLPSNLSFNAANKFSADFACLYFSAKNYLRGGVMYDPHADPFQRPAVTFPPHLIFGVAHSIGNLMFPLAAGLLIFFQLFLFLAVSIYFFSGAKKIQPQVYLPQKQVLVLILALTYFIFASPVSLSWLERSQTDFFMASAYLMLLKAMRDGKLKDFIFAGLISSLKWSSLPFIALAEVAYIILSKDKIKGILQGAIPLMTPFVLLIPFGQNSLSYLGLIKSWEGQNGVGTSLLLHMPSYLAKTLPFLIPFIYAYLSNARGELELIFWGICGLVAATYGTVVYEYKMISLIFLIPLVIDGRSIFFEQKNLVLWKRVLIGTLFLSYALEINFGLTFWDHFMNSNRALKPFIIGLTLFGGFKVFSRKAV